MAGGGIIPVAGVSVGDVGKFGTASVVNTAATIAPEGLNAGKVSLQNAVFFDGQTGAAIWFAFDQKYTLPTPLNVPFTFSGDLTVTKVSAGDVSRFGVTTTYKTAKDAFPSGWDSQRVSGPKVYHAGADGAGVDFPFTETYDKPLQLNAPFYFGGNPVVTGLTLGDQSRFGSIHDIKKPLQLSPSGWLTEVVAKPRLGATGGIDFRFVDVYDRPLAVNVPYYFGGGISLTATLGRTDAFGSGRVENSAKTAAPEGFSTEKIGRAAAYFQNQNGVGVDFKFAQSYNGQTPLNVPFYFAGLININVGGIDPPEPGVPNIQKRDQDVYPLGIGDLLFGKVVLEQSLAVPQTITGQSFGDADFGKPSVSPQFVTKITLSEVTTFGTAKLTQERATQYVRPGGMDFGALGDKLKVDPRFLYLFPWISSSMGAPNVARNPSPLGIEPPDMGIPRVDDGKQFVDPPSLVAPEEFFPVPNVKGHWEYVYPWPVPESGIFGDIAVRNQSRYVGAEGIDSLVFPDYRPNVYNARFVVLPFGIQPTVNDFTRPAVRNAAEHVVVPGIEPGDIGSHDAGLLVRYVLPVALEMTEWGLPSVRNLAQIVAPNGIAGEFGDAMVAYAIRYINVDGIDYLKIGKDTEVGEWHRPLRDVGGIEQSTFGTSVIESTLRTITVGDGFQQDGYGTPHATFAIQKVEPPGIGYAFTWDQIGSGWVEFSVRYVGPFGTMPPVPGEPFVARKEFIVEPSGFRGETGVPHVEWSRRYVGPREFIEEDVFGTPWASRSTRYIEPFQDTESLKFEAGIVGEPWLENSFKTITTFGHGSSRLGSGASVLHNAVVLEATGTDSSEFGKDGLVAYRIRTLDVQGYDSFLAVVGPIVFNLAQIIEVTGIPRPYMGVPYVWSNTQWVDLFGSNNDHGEWGRAMVADAIRYVKLEADGGTFKFSIPPGEFGALYTGLWTQYIAPPGKDFQGVGDMVAEVKWTKIHPWGEEQSQYGTAEVRNVTPQVYPWPWDPEDIPRPAVSFYTREVAPEGMGDMGRPLKPLVQYRDKTLYLTGIAEPAFTRLHDVRGDYPDIPPRQVAFPVMIPEWDYDLGGGSNRQVGKHSVTSNVIYHNGIEANGEMTQFGKAWVRVQGCSPFWDWPSSQWSFGTPSLNRPIIIENVTLQPSFNTEGFDPDNPSGIVPSTEPGLIVFGKPRITPHTIWCTPDTPEQAERNHPEGHKFGLLDASKVRSADVQWGRTEVTLAEGRVVGVRTVDDKSGWVGEAEVANWRRWIHPVGKPPGKFGFPELPTNIEVFAGRLDSLVMGEPSLSIELIERDFEAAPQGHVSSAFGDTQVDLLHRAISPSGIAPRTWAGWGYSYEMVYHYPRGISGAGGSDTTEWGVPYVDFKNRAIAPEGTDHFESEYTPALFSIRMKVYHLTHPTTPASWEEQAFGTAAIRLATLRINPYQIEQPRCMGHDVTISHKE